MRYKFLKDTPAGDKWNRIGTSKRSGIAVPLFSVYSSGSTGIGEYPDLKLLADWCNNTGMSILQLLPLNETGFDFSPYNVISTFALEPMYLRLSELKETDVGPFKKEISVLGKKYDKRTIRVNYGIKQDKLSLLWKIFNKSSCINTTGLNEFIEANSYWIDDYALYKTIKEKNGGLSWQNWDKDLREHNIPVLSKFGEENKIRIMFYCWIQWQCYEQLKEVKKYLSDKKLLIMGDLPFLVSSDSADVWSHPAYFKMELSAGAPPDMYFALGQKWGNPPYNWENIEKDRFRYIKEKIKYTENFYDMYRIDHFVGLFRVWTITNLEDESSLALNGKFDPEDESVWEEHGKKIIRALLDSSSMLPCGEDLGTVPECSYEALREYGIPGTDFQRFLKIPSGNYEFININNYRYNSTAVISTHDTSFFLQWWNHEAGTIDEKLFELTCLKHNIRGKRFRQIKDRLFDKKYPGRERIYWKEKIDSVFKLLKILGLQPVESKDLITLYMESHDEKKKFLKYLSLKNVSTHITNHSLIKHCLETINSSASIFSIQLLQEYLCLDKELIKTFNKWTYRINRPGIMNKNNWSIRLPLNLEKLNDLDINKTIYNINKRTKRIA
jgi:4-alpha-glucanotransferase